MPNPGNPELREIAQEYKREHGITAPDYGSGKLDPARSQRIADAYEAMPHQPDHPAVSAAYGQLKHEVLQQYHHLQRHGYTMEPWHGEGQPYANSAEMVADVANNKHLHYFPTESGYGEGGDVSDNPLLEPTGMHHNGRPILYNDAFRAVHDAFGHAQRGHQFGPQGEENAWREHSSMFTPLANAALSTETRGQNSWVNFGKHIRRPDGSIPKSGEPDYIHPTERPYAEQKSGLLPPEFWYPES